MLGATSLRKLLFPAWVPTDVSAEAARLSEKQAAGNLSGLVSKPGGDAASMSVLLKEPSNNKPPEVKRR